MPEYINMSVNVALHICTSIAMLFREGAGVRISDFEDDEDSVPGMIDELPAGSEVEEWANAVLGLLRLVYGVLRHNLNEAYLLEDDILTDEE